MLSTLSIRNANTEILTLRVRMTNKNTWQEQIPFGNDKQKERS